MVSFAQKGIRLVFGSICALHSGTLTRSHNFFFFSRDFLRKFPQGFSTCNRIPTVWVRGCRLGGCELQPFFCSTRCENQYGRPGEETVRAATHGRGPAQLQSWAKTRSEGAHVWGKTGDYMRGTGRGKIEIELGKVRSCKMRMYCAIFWCVAQCNCNIKICAVECVYLCEVLIRYSQVKTATKKVVLNCAEIKISSAKHVQGDQGTTHPPQLVLLAAC